MIITKAIGKFTMPNDYTLFMFDIWELQYLYHNNPYVQKIMNQHTWWWSKTKDGDNSYYRIRIEQKSIREIHGTYKGTPSRLLIKLNISRLKTEYTNIEWGE